MDFDNITKYTEKEIFNLCIKRNIDRKVHRQYGDTQPLHIVAVVSQDNFKKEYNLQSRSYEFRSDEKRFIFDMYGNSIFATNLTKDDHIRLDWYLDTWKIDFYYIKEIENNE